MGIANRGGWWALLLAGTMGAVCLVAEEPLENSDQLLDRLEWRGIMSLPGEIRFSFHDQAGLGGFWVGLGEVRAGIEVVDYDRERNEVTVRHGDATRTLSMSGATVVPLGGEPEQVAPPAEPREEPPEELPDENDPTLDEEQRERLTRLWGEAATESASIRRIDDRLRELFTQQEALAAALAETSRAAPAFSDLTNRLAELAQEESGYIEGALVEVADLQVLSEQDREELAAALRAGHFSQLALPSTDPYDSPQVGEGALEATPAGEPTERN